MISNIIIKIPGPQGAGAWTPVFAFEEIADRTLLKVVDWTGGAGTMPDVDLYVGPSGFTDDPNVALNVMGPSGRAIDTIVVDEQTGNLDITFTSGDPISVPAFLQGAFDARDLALTYKTNAESAKNLALTYQTNAGNSASQSANSAAAANALVTGQSTSRASIKANLLLDLTNETLDPRIKFSRNDANHSYFDYKGLLKLAKANVWPREFNPITGQCLGRTPWEASTNLELNSEDFSTATHNKSRCNIIINDAIDAYGTTTMDKIVGTENATGGMYIISTTYTNTGTVATRSIFLRKGTHDYAILTIGDTAFLNYVNQRFNLATAMVANSFAFGSGFSKMDAKIIDCGNGLYRCTLSANVPAVNLKSIVSPSVPSEVSTAVAIGDVGYVWGSQFELKSFVTPYIPTGSASATRNACIPYIDGIDFSDFYNPNEGTLMVGATVPTPAGATRRIAALTDGSTANSIQLGAHSVSAAYIEVREANVLQASNTIGGAIAVGNTMLLAFGYKKNDFYGYANGASLIDSSGNIPQGINQLHIGYAPGVGYFNAPISHISYWSKRLSNTEVQGVVSIGLLSGKNPNQLPAGSDLAEGATMNRFQLGKNASDYVQNKVAERPIARPTLNLDFANSDVLDPRITYTRNDANKSYFDKNGILRMARPNEWPREFDPITGACLGRSVWDSSTNMYSNSKNGGLTSSPQVTRVDNQPSLDGLNNASIYSNTPNANSSAYNISVELLAGNTYTYSFFARAESFNCKLFLEKFVAVTNSTEYFDISAGVAYGPNFRMVSLPDGWYRCIATKTFSVNSWNYLYIGGYGNTPNAVSVRIWGGQLEQKAFASPYIPTTTVAVTRATDVASMTGVNFLDWYNPSEGAFLLDATSTMPVGNINIGGLGVTNDTNNEGLHLLIRRATTGGQVQVIVKNAGTLSVQSNVLPEYTTDTRYYITHAYAKNNHISVANGSTVVTDTYGDVPIVNKLLIGSLEGANILNGHISCIAYWPKHLTNTELQALTKTEPLSGREPNQIPSAKDLRSGAFMDVSQILRAKGRQEFMFEGTGANNTVKIQRKYPFRYELEDATGVTLVAQPDAICDANTAYFLTYNAPADTYVTISITPII